MAIADDFTIDYVANRVYHSSGTTVYSLNQLYTYFTLTFDDDLQMDDLPPMSAQTPTAFTMENGWFIDSISLRFLNGGSLNTLGWNAGSYDTGIRVITFDVPYTAAIITDIGKPVTGADSAGILLYYDNALKKWWIRPNSTADTFALTETLSVTGGTGSGTTAGASLTGENTWTNIFTLGTLAANTQIYLYQSDAQIIPWWNPGHIDVLILVKEANALIDYGFITIFVRQYTKLYDHYTADLSAGARTPIPLATFNDASNPTGYLTFTGSAGSGTFQAKEIIQKSGDPATAGVVTTVTGTTTDPILTYYLFKHPLTNFSNGDAITGLTSNASCTAAAPTTTGPASLVGITFTFNATTHDLNNGNGARPYDCVINCNSYPLSSVYEYIKYLNRYGESSTINGHPGEAYIGVGEIRLPYSGQTNNFSAGTTINGQTSGATGIIVSDHDDGVTGALILRDTTDTFQSGEKIRVGVTEYADAGIPTAITPSKQSPFGTFAGGKFFGAQGVWLDNVPGYEANNFELTDSEGVSQLPPQTIGISVLSVASGDQVSVFRTTGDNEIVDKSIYTSHAANNTTGSATFTVQQVIANDTPSEGFVRVVQRTASGSILGEDRYAYQSWFGSTFNLNGGVTLIRNYTTNDTAYVPYIDAQASSTAITVTVSYVANRYVLTRVRKRGILPFTVTGQITSAGLTITAIRTPDTIQT
jgi:hypothetical protein